MNALKKCEQDKKLSEQLETFGFDISAGSVWIYPTNLSIRSYQYNIVQKALHENTLVSLPTGLGKTFIAAVVMYNFYRWYPNGKIIFLAPTRPLVKQQIEACYNIMAIPKTVTAELTGMKTQIHRQQIWNEKRVFFATPQVLQNDLRSFPHILARIKCIVFDEAHKARGNYAYCEVIRLLKLHTNYFRVLALSATPGNTNKDVAEVIRALLISHVEFRTEQSLDVREYVFQRKLDTVVVPLDEKLEEIKNRYVEILEKNTRQLVKLKVLQGNAGAFTKGKIFMVMKDFQARSKGIENYNECMRDLNICVTLYHAFELLIRHGLRGFLSFFEEHIQKPLLRNNTQLMDIMENIRGYLGPPPVMESLPNGTTITLSKDTKFGHPKFYKLRDILLEHFNSTIDKSSRVIVFFEYRDSVMEAYALLFQFKPLIMPKVFLGKTSGITQKLQINVIKSFREGSDCNTLLSTCIGEEGLDVGDVDLIVCFDISNKSPIRMIQRMGRTGRKRKGRIVALVTAGKEQEILQQCLAQKNYLANASMSTNYFADSLYKDNPKMIPSEIQIKCQKMFITVPQVPLKKNATLKDMFNRMSSGSSLADEEVDGKTLSNYLPSNELLWNKQNPIECNDNNLDMGYYSRHIENQRILQSTISVEHSTTTEYFVDLLRYSDCKRFNIPLTKTTSMNRNYKQEDIRNMFVARPISESDLEVQNNNVTEMVPKTFGGYSDEFFNKISTYLTSKCLVDKECGVCQNFFPCSKYLDTIVSRTKFDINSRVIPTIKEPLKPVGTNEILAFIDKYKKPDTYNSDLNESRNAMENTPKSFNENSTNKGKSKIGSKELSALKNINFSSFFGNSFECFQEVEPFGMDQLNDVKSPDGRSFDSVNEIYAPLDTNSGKLPNTPNVEIVQTENVHNTSFNESILSFFHLSNLNDLFVPERSLEPHPVDVRNTNFSTAPNSPDLFDDNSINSPNNNQSQNLNNAVISISDESESPIFCSFNTIKSLKNASRQLFNNCDMDSSRNSNANETNRSRDEEYECTQRLNIGTPKKPPDLIQNQIENANNQKSTNGATTRNHVENTELGIDDLCDLSSILGRKIDDISAKANLVTEKEDLNISSICDLTSFGICAVERQTTVENITYNKNEMNPDERNCISKTNICNLSKRPNISIDNDVILSLGKSKSYQKMPSISEKTTTSNLDQNNIRFSNKYTDKFMDQSSTTDSIRKTNCLSLNNNIMKRNSRITKIVQTSHRLSPPIPVIFSSDDSDFEECPQFISKRLNRHNSTIKQRQTLQPKRKKLNQFIEDKAEVSVEEEVSEDETVETSDNYDTSFINDEPMQLCTQTHVNYMKTVECGNNRKFKIGVLKEYNVDDVLSQAVDTSRNAYVNDSFCVDTVESCTQIEKLTELEKLEDILEQKRKEKKRKRNKTNNQQWKRRRIIRSSSESN